MSIVNLMNNVMVEAQYLPPAEMAVSLHELIDQEQTEVLAFLAERPVHTVCLAGLIRDNGLESAHNRGTFYGCRDSEGRLEGVALIGHATLIEARTERALKEFALMAQTSINTHLIMGEKEKIEQFWNLYADEGQHMRLVCCELLFELRRAVEVPDAVSGLRLATLDDLELVAPVHAGMAFAESGINPLDVDPVGFRQRCARRIEKGRVWVIVEDGQLIFKADIQADTPEVIYLEGIYVQPGKRGQGIGRRSLSQLTQQLLTRSSSVCVLVNANQQSAHSFYRFSNFKLNSLYYTIFMESAESREQSRLH